VLANIWHDDDSEDGCTVLSFPKPELFDVKAAEDLMCAAKSVPWNREALARWLLCATTPEREDEG
jgi:hypothetical protein